MLPFLSCSFLKGKAMKNSLFMTLFCVCCLLTSWCVSAQNDDSVWLSIDPNEAKHFLKTQKLMSKAEAQISIKRSQLSTVNFLKLKSEDIVLLSEFMHHNYNRCGGFVAHDSLTDAQHYAKQLAFVENQMIKRDFNYSIDTPQTAQDLISRVSQNTLTNTVNTLSNFYNRYYTSQTGIDASQWIKNNWLQLANARDDISVELFTHSWAQSSIIVTINGNEKADEIVVIGGHLDSINQSNPLNGRSPGADDNASGIAVLTEALRVITQHNFKPKRTIKIMAFAAEEVGLRGSKEIASLYKSQGKNVVGMVQFDMTGNKGSDDDIVMMTDYTTGAQNQFLGELIDTYLPSVSYGFDQCGYGCSDHASWYQQGFRASVPFESRMADINQTIHTQGDTEFDAEHASKFAKLAVSYLVEMAKKSSGTVPPQNNNELQNGVTVTGINAPAKEQVIYTLQVPTNASNLSFSTNGGTGDVDLYVKFNAVPTLNSFDCKSTGSTNNERCDITSVQNGTYYVMLDAWSAIEEVSLIANYTDTPIIEPINRTLADLNVSSNNWLRYTQNLAAGYTSLDVNMSGGTGDGDLYLNFNTPSTEQVYLCRPFKNGNNEACRIENPQQGTWYIDIKGYSTAKGITVTINAK